MSKGLPSFPWPLPIGASLIKSTTLPRKDFPCAANISLNSFSSVVMLLLLEAQIQLTAFQSRAGLWLGASDLYPMLKRFQPVPSTHQIQEVFRGAILCDCARPLV